MTEERAFTTAIKPGVTVTLVPDFIEHAVQIMGLDSEGVGFCLMLTASEWGALESAVEMLKGE